MVQYNLVRDNKLGNLISDFNKIVDYLLTFTGDISINKESPGKALISYTGTQITATLITDTNPAAKDIESSQMTLNCEDSDGVSINLIKNVLANIGYRVFNPQTQSYLVNDPGVLDLTTGEIDSKIKELIKSNGLKPIFRYRDNLTFFAVDKKGQIHLINRHLLQQVINLSRETGIKIKIVNDFSVVVAKNIGSFVAMFDRGLISLSFYKNADNDVKVINLSDFDIDKLQRTVDAETIMFTLDRARQTFSQTSSQVLEIKKGKPLIKSLKLDKYLAVKIAGDIGYDLSVKPMIPKLKVMVFLDK